MFHNLVVLKQNNNYTHRPEARNCTCTTCILGPMGQVDKEQGALRPSEEKEVQIFDAINMIFHNLWPEDGDDNTLPNESDVTEMDQLSANATASLS